MANYLLYWSLETTVYLFPAVESSYSPFGILIRIQQEIFSGQITSHSTKARQGYIWGVMASSAHMDMLDENIDSLRGWETIVWHGFHLEDWRRHGVINRVAYFEVITWITFWPYFLSHRCSVLNRKAKISEWHGWVDELFCVMCVSLIQLTEYLVY